MCLLRSTHPALLKGAEDGKIPPVHRPAIDTAGPSKQGRQKELDKALVDMVVKDLQPSWRLKPWSCLKSQKDVGLFRCSCKAKDKLIQEVETRWKSTFDMLQRLSEEQRVSASKLIPLYSNQHKQESTAHTCKKVCRPDVTHMSHSEPWHWLHWLDPKFKIVAFGNPAKAQEAEKHHTLECASLMLSNPTTHEPQLSTSHPSSSSTTQAVSQDCLWELLDNRVRESQTVHSATADATAGGLSHTTYTL
ncbi:Dihydroxy-acid dehydratase [Labeo rohita]|uniref:Dihydroxy-acid dehydratase n=1 Tax=Labeo rohita TaxID=84645 RepID=A0ABQ8M4B4_LABRO|nr:Dihydroxy-acid dehydratase [Labeo rohita]